MNRKLAAPTYDHQRSVTLFTSTSFCWRADNCVPAFEVAFRTAPHAHKPIVTSHSPSIKIDGSHMNKKKIDLIYVGVSFGSLDSLSSNVGCRGSPP